MAYTQQQQYTSTSPNSTPTHQNLRAPNSLGTRVEIDLTTPPPSSTPRKRTYGDITLGCQSSTEVSVPSDSSSNGRPLRQRKGEHQEKRLRRYKNKEPNDYVVRRHRAVAQRMFLLNREKSRSDDGKSPLESFKLAGTTGNVYTITISLLPDCSCPDAQKGNCCKHIIYVSSSNTCQVVQIDPFSKTHILKGLNPSP